MSVLRLSPSPSPTRPNFLDNESDNDGSDLDQAASISLSSPRHSVQSTQEDPLSLEPVSLDDAAENHVTAASSTLATPKAADASVLANTDLKDVSLDEAPMQSHETHANITDADSTTSKTSPSSAASQQSMDGDTTERSSQTSITSQSIKYPPTPLRQEGDAASMMSHASSSSKKARPESVLIEPPIGPIVPGIALVDFNHMVGPKVEFSSGKIFEDEQLVSILPFLALPDGAHLSSEDYSYFHLVPTSPNPNTIFGISCNRQMKAEDLLVKNDEVTRSTIQKAVVVLASKPVFGPIRDRLGVVTQALFEQRDFRETSILVDFQNSLEAALRNQLTESALYMGTSLRELVHKFRSRTLLLLKALILQKRIMFYGHPVERLCTYQYSLISLIPGLLQYLDDSGSPPLAARATTLSRATSLRTSDRKSLMAYLGLPLDLFGKDAFFQPYLPLQQVDLIKETRSYLCGSTNSIVTQQKDIDLLVNIETNTFEFRDPQLERIVALTPADRKWMDDIVKDVNESWDDTDPMLSSTMRFRGSDDYIRTKFEEYVTAALSSVKYADFLRKGSQADVMITSGDGGDVNAIMDFNPSWIAEFKKTNAYEVWNRITDPMVFDIVEARHPCNNKPGVVEDIGLRLQEGLQDLNIGENLAPTREAIAKTLASGSSNFFKAVEGVRGRWAQRAAGSPDPNSVTPKTPSAVDITKMNSELPNAASTASPRSLMSRLSTASSLSTTSSAASGLRPLSLGAAAQPAQQAQPAQVAADARAAVTSWGSSIGSYFSQRSARLSVPRRESVASVSSSTSVPTSNGASDRNSITSLGATQSAPPSVPIEDPNTARPSPTPITSVFSSWSFGRSSSSIPSQTNASPSSPSSQTQSQKHASLSIDPFVQTKAGSAPDTPEDDPELPYEFRPRNLDKLEEVGGEEFATLTVAEPDVSIEVDSSSINGSEEAEEAGYDSEKVEEVELERGKEGLEEPKSPTTMSVSSSSASFVQPGMAI